MNKTTCTKAILQGNSRWVIKILAIRQRGQHTQAIKAAQRCHEAKKEYWIPVPLPRTLGTLDTLGCLH